MGILTTAGALACGASVLQAVSAAVPVSKAPELLYPPDAALLEAMDFGLYPSYSGDLAVSGKVQIAQRGTGSEATQVMNFVLSGTDPACGTANVTGVANACGIHIHEGTSCSNASEIGGHFWNKTAFGNDPWASVMYSDTNGTASGNMEVTTGLTNAEVADRVLVVHDKTGARIACASMASLGSLPVASPGSLTASNFERYPTYSGNLSVTGEVYFQLVESEGDAAQAMSYRLTGVDPLCGSENVSGVANACGIHIHEGTSCSNASSIGGHFWNKTSISSDPWLPVMYATVDLAFDNGDSNDLAAGRDVVVVTGLSNVEVSDRVVVVHDVTGARVACSPMMLTTEADLSTTPAATKAGNGALSEARTSAALTSTLMLAVLVGAFKTI